MGTPQKSTLLQSFEWNVPEDGKHWARLREQLPTLHKIGITSLWLPPGCKAASPKGNGYDIYDLWDLGEFDQKGSRRTKWGSKEDLVELARHAKDLGIGLYWDAVLNHKAGADRTEKCTVVEVDPGDRTKDISEPHEIEGWLGFDFDGRGGKYSDMKWHAYHFTGTDWDEATKKKAIYRIVGDNKSWSASVDNEQGNDDYMMFADVDYHHEECRDDVKNWAVWITKELGLKGFRMDAVQHFSERFTAQWVKHLREECGKDMFVVGEFWVDDAQKMMDWLGKMERQFSLFDSPLLNSFHNISMTEKADIRTVFDKALVKSEPYNAVTVVTNHDTQPGQTVETPIAGWFKPLAYALILLRAEGYPCVFYGDLYGTRGDKAEPPSCNGKLADLVLARSLYAYGEQEDYFDEENCIGWVCRGTPERRFGLACVMSNAEPGERRMFVGEMHAGEKWSDVLGWENGDVTVDGEGWGVFPCPGVSVSVWVNSEAEGRDLFPVDFDPDIYSTG